ncbi:class I SAM-dependent methyltransferase [Candidatus Binatia bacterium]|nr:class I SAM-dependent methyltransferase [Candidatus Binatia bacterium]
MDADRKRWEDRYGGSAAAGSRATPSRRQPGPDDPPSGLVAAVADRIHGRVLDIAAGTGRNALFLARRGCRVEAIDFSHAGLRLALAAARRDGLSISAVQADLSSYPLPIARYDAAINIRYLLRSLFPTLRQALRPGGLVVVETFLIRQLALGHPSNPEFLLHPGELGEAFAGFDIDLYEEGLFPDGGRQAYLARLVARRPRD